jgi:lysophospholipid acyltransferase
LFVTGVVGRARFAGAWKVGESCCLITGIGYGIDPKTKQVRFDMAENLDIVGVESGENVKVMMDAWNKFTANWLRRYVYVRVSNTSAKLPMTFFISAFWHGFYPGYYLSFMFSVPLMQCGRAMRKHVRPIFKTGTLKYLALPYDFAGRVGSIFCMNYLFACFFLRHIDPSLALWSSIYFVGHLIFFLPVILLNYTGLSKKLAKYQGLVDAKPKTQ